MAMGGLGTGDWGLGTGRIRGSLLEAASVGDGGGGIDGGGVGGWMDGSRFGGRGVEVELCLHVGLATLSQGEVVGRTVNILILNLFFRVE